VKPGGKPLAFLGAAIVALPVLVAAPAAAEGLPNEPGVRSSWNIRHLANVPKQKPFEGIWSLGSDIAFTGNKAIVGNFDGFTIFDIRNPRKPKVLSNVVCPGAQNDPSVHGDLLFVSTDSSRSNDTCTSQPLPRSDPNAWEGIKIFDISDPRSPKYVTSVRTDCGSHTQTLVPDKRGKDVYVYISSFFSDTKFPHCQPPHDLISVVKVPVRNPAAAAVVAKPVLFPDGGNPGNPTTGTSKTDGCHDVTVYPAKDLAAGACMGDGILFDISDREKPKVISRVRDDTHFAFWHSATFNNEGTKVVFTDELGGGLGPMCNDKIGQQRGADGIYDITGRKDNRKLEFRSFFKIPRVATDTENCVAHNGSLIPVLGRDIMVQGWYQGGFSVFDFTDSAKPKEIAYWDRPPLSDKELLPGGAWSAYYYNGHIYTSDLQKGLDVFEINDPRVLTAKFVRMNELNVQTQPSFWR
jgi:hypothetical protein